ncbi:hypothetical protein Q8F55_005508 [Vanrija albida]|uniref:Uncharacterized protein n=1 Tax=Vanrija albida TaxID=181172 RepID=A0ABR3Q227_9TREE
MSTHEEPKVAGEVHVNDHNGYNSGQHLNVYNSRQPGFPIYGPKKKANPGPLGLFCFASTTLLLSFINVKARHLAEPNIVTGLAFALGGAGQFLAGILEFCVGNTFGLTAFVSYGGFWISVGFLFWPSSGMLAAYKGTDLDQALGLFMMVWFVFTTLMLLATFRSSAGLVAVFFFLSLTFLLLGIGYLLVKPVILKAAGYFGIVTAACAYYTALHGLLTAEAAPFGIPNPSLARKED